MLKKILHFFSSSFVANITSTLLNYVAAKQLGPQVMGTWQTAKIALSYTGFLDFGTSFSLTREIPQLRAENNQAAAEEIRQTVFTYNLVVSFFSALVVIGFSIWSDLDDALSFSLYIVAFMTFLRSYLGLNNVYWKGRNNYAVVTKAGYLTVPANLVNLGMLFMFGFKGYVIGRLFEFLFSSIYYFSIRDYINRFAFSLKTWKRAFTVGFPIFVENVIDIVLSTIDKMIIVSYLGVKQLGFYSIAGLLSTPITMLIASISTVFFTEILFTSHKNRDKKLLSRNYAIPADTLAFILPFFLAGLSLILPLLIDTLLPDYSEGTVPAQIVIWGIYFYSMSSFFSNILVSINKQKLIPLAALISSLTNLFLGIVFVKLGYGLKGVAASTLLSYVCHFVLLFGFTHKHFGIARWPVVLMKNFAPIVLSAMLLGVLRATRFSSNIVFEYLLEFAVLLLFSTPFLIVGIRRILNYRDVAK